MELVQKANISKRSISFHLSRNYIPKQDKLELIAGTLDVNVDQLLRKNVPMQIPAQNIIIGQVSPLPYAFY